jgi:hypothetical protein
MVYIMIGILRWLEESLRSMGFGIRSQDDMLAFGSDMSKVLGI